MDIKAGRIDSKEEEVEKVTILDFTSGPEGMTIVVYISEDGLLKSCSLVNPLNGWSLFRIRK